MASLDKRKPAVLSEVIAIWQLSGCATSPVTGGLDFVLMSGEQVAGAPSHEIGHVTARKSVRQQSVQAIGNTFARLAGSLHWGLIPRRNSGC